MNNVEGSMNYVEGVTLGIIYLVLVSPVEDMALRVHSQGNWDTNG